MVIHTMGQLDVNKLPEKQLRRSRFLILIYLFIYLSISRFGFVCLSRQRDMFINQTKQN